MQDRQLGGIGFIIGNTALFLNGLIASLYANTPESRKAGAARMISSGMWATSGGFLAKYGDRPVAAQEDRLEHKLAAFLHQSGAPLDAASLRRANAETHQGWFRKLEDFFYAHPIECTNAYYSAASAGFAFSGSQRRHDGNMLAGNANIATSALATSGALASIIIPEKTPEQIAAQGQQGTLWGKIQQAPLSYVKWLFLGADAMAGVESLGEYAAAGKVPHGHPYRSWQFTMAALSAVAMGSNLVGDWLTSGSKKAGGTPQERDAAQHMVLQHAAQHLASLPYEQQMGLTKMVAVYLTQQHELRFQDQSADKIADHLLQQIQILSLCPTPTVNVQTPAAAIKLHENEMVVIR